MGAIPVVLGALAMWNYWPSDEGILIGRHTTYIAGPLHADGTVDYVAAVDAMYSEGVTSENNAAIPLLQAVGPAILRTEIRQKTYQRLGMVALSGDGNCFVDWATWVAAHPDRFGAGPGQALKNEVRRQAWDKAKPATTRPWTQSEEPALAAWLEDNAIPLGLAEKASARPRFFLGFIPSGFPEVVTASGCQMIPVRDLAPALSARTMLRIGGKDLRGAWSDVLTSVRLGRLLEQDPRSVIAILGAGFEDSACRAGIILVDRLHPTAAQARAMLADLESLPPETDFAQVVDRGERFFALDTITYLHGVGNRTSGGGQDELPFGRSHLNWNAVLRAINEHYDKELAILKSQPGTERTRQMANVASDLRAMAQETGKSGPGTVLLYRLGGRLTQDRLTRATTQALLSLLAANSVGAWNEMEESRTPMDLLKTLLATTAFRQEKGHLPGSLSDLCPDYLKKVPLDRFSGQPLNYLPKGNGFLVYSVGPNGKDEGGVGGAVKGADDISAEVGTGGE